MERGGEKVRQTPRKGERKITKDVKIVSMRFVQAQISESSSLEGLAHVSTLCLYNPQANV